MAATPDPGKPKSSAIPATIIESNTKHENKSKWGRILLGIIILCSLITFWIRGCEKKPTPQQQAIAVNPDLNLHPAEYNPDICTDPKLRVSYPADADMYADLKLGKPIKIKLHKGCFANIYDLPTEFNYKIQLSNAKGDWAAVWCLGGGNPNPPTRVLRYYYDENRPGDVCPRGTSSEPNYTLEGVGLIFFIPTAKKTIFG